MGIWLQGEEVMGASVAPWLHDEGGRGVSAWLHDEVDEWKIMGTFWLGLVREVKKVRG